MRLLWILFCNILAIILMGGVVAALTAVFIIQHYSQDLPDVAQLADYDPPVVTRLYAADNRLLAEYAEQRRVYVPLSSIPRRVIQAFLSAEDRNFYRHQGIDIYGIGRAVMTNLNNFGQNHTLVGGSTITQQVVKNFLLTKEKSFQRKIKEAILAYRISKAYSKNRILELYLNEIYLGQGSYGVAAAALTYFNKPLEELTIEEAAFLASLPKAPANYDPSLHYDRAKARRDWVIGRMEEDKYINHADVLAAQHLPIITRARDATEVARADFFAEEVRRELAAMYGSDVLYKGGLYVKTTLNPQLQQYAEKSLRSALTEYDRRHGWRGPLMHVPQLSHAQHGFSELRQKNPPLFDGERLAVVIKLEKDKAEIAFEDKTTATIAAADMAWLKRSRSGGLGIGDIIIAKPVEGKKGAYEPHQIPEVNGALVAMDPHTGRVLALAGGYSYGGTEFDRATQAKRQPGSSFKPFVYLTALENHFTPSTIVLDGPVTVDTGQGSPNWSPENFASEYLGPATLRQGLEKSRNTMTVRLAQMIELDKILETSQKFGIYDNPPKYFSIVLGAVETTLMRMTNAYCILANGGKKVTPSLIERIDDRNGKAIFRRDQRPCQGCVYSSTVDSITPLQPILPDAREQVVDPLSDYQIVHMMEGVIERGTAAKARSLGRPIAGKTGTTNDSRDTWFIGFSPDLAVGVFVGYDQPRSLGGKETGASVALPGFIQFMEMALKDVPPKPFKAPDGIVMMKVDLHTGLPPVEGIDTGPFIQEAFKPGELPQPSFSTEMPSEMQYLTEPEQGLEPNEHWQPEYGQPFQGPGPAPFPRGGPNSEPLPNDNGTGGMY